MDTCCRTCSRNDNFQGISVDAISENNQEPVYLMLIYCTQLQFSNRENFPQQICYECMNLLDAAYAFWKQCRQADATLQQQVVFGSGGEPASITTTTPSYPVSEGQTRIADLQPPPQDDEANFHAEESKFNAQSQVISINEDVESEAESEVEVTEEPPAPEAIRETFVGEEAIQHRQYIIDSEAESEIEEEQEPEPEPVPVRVARPAFKIKMNYNKKSKLMTTGRLKCHICKKTFHTTTHLHRHLKAHKTTCQHCAKNLSSVNSLMRHQTQHCPVLKNVNYTAYCEHCNRGFTKPAHIKRHQQQVCPVLHPEGSVNVNTHQCQYCGKGFSSNTNVMRHQRENCPVLKRNPNPQPKSFHIQKQCAYCRKRFNTSKEIKRHVRTCPRRRPFNTSVPSPMVSVAAAATNRHDDDIDSPDYEVHPSELLDCVMKQEPDELLVGN